MQDIELAAGRVFREIGMPEIAGDEPLLRGLTLTTFAEVPWNAPYYARCGFRVLDDSELSPGMRTIRDREIAHGLHRWPRVYMRRDL